VPISDGQFRLAVIGAGALLVVGITAVRFCGAVSLPPKPSVPAPTSSGAVTSSGVHSSIASPSVYQEFLAKDAAVAGVHAPTIEDMKKKLVARVDEGRHVVDTGQRALAIAGLELTLVRDRGVLELDIANATGADIAYLVQTAPVPNISSCASAPALPLNVMVLRKDERVRRVECQFRDGMSIVVTRVETVELSPLSAFYVASVPPALVGIEDRIARAHRGPTTNEPCSMIVSQAVRSGLERGEIGWRDLVDFYARHRCQTYQFPASYRAFTADGQRELPAVSSGM
jgi:hypothetical protein